MLIIDEFHSLLVGTPRLQRQVMNAIKMLCNELQIPIVGVGAKDAIRVLHTYPQHASRFDVAELPTWKLDQVIDWQPIEQYLNRQRTRYLRDHRGRPAYPLLSMFKAVLLGQWHSLFDPELEHSLITRIDFNLFCRFDELSIPDYSTICRYRNWLAQDNTLSELLKLIN